MRVDLAREGRSRLDPERYARADDDRWLRRVFDLGAASLHAIAMPSLDRVLGADGLDYARAETRLDGELLRDRSFIGFDYPGDYYTPAFCVEDGRIMVQVGDDHGVFDDGRPTVPFDDYLALVIATRGSIEARNQAFGLRGDGTFSRQVRTIDSLLPPPAAVRDAARSRDEQLAAALPVDARLRALVEAAEVASESSIEEQRDGRSLVRIVRPDGSRQLAFLTVDERAAFDRAIEARRALRA